MKPRLLDLFCGAGGAARGYQQAGFYVVGVDINPQPRYAGDEFHRADAMTFPLDGFDVIHASPPCQHYANVTRWRGDQNDHLDLVDLIIERMENSRLPWILENVPGAPFVPQFVLCGSMFGLRVRRHRWFVTSWNAFALVPRCEHQVLLPFMHKGERAYADATECQWMSSIEARQAIPPAYTQFIGEQLISALSVGSVGDTQP